jgi:hypothetical protein
MLVSCGLNKTVRKLLRGIKIWTGFFQEISPKHVSLMVVYGTAKLMMAHSSRISLSIKSKKKAFLEFNEKGFLIS